jgi:hypothetical protein
VRVGIMQPYFFPYLGYLALIAKTDRWVVFDITQYTPKTWMNRNRVLHPTAGWNWVTVALSNSSNSIRIDEALVQSPGDARTTVLGKLSHYRKQAPHYAAVTKLVEQAFDAPDDASLARLDTRALAAVCDYLELPFSYSFASELEIDCSGVDHPGGWAPTIAAGLGAQAYLNPIGGRALFDPAEFDDRGVELLFLESPTFDYGVGTYDFEPNLSVLDVLMWNSPEEVRRAIDTARVLPADACPELGAPTGSAG